MAVERHTISSGGPYEDVYGYSRAVRIGDLVFVAGTCAQPPDVDGCDAATQTAAAIRIIEAALRDAGATLDDVVRTRIFVVDHDDVDAVLRVHGDVFGSVRPAATLLRVAGLIDPELLVEIEVDAVISGTVEEDRPTTVR
ncbi:MAG: Rid family hydrolase [Actinomycetota bacterium]